jgi:short-subunit dehydrogenase
MKKNAIIVGASSGIGKALAGILSREGYRLGLIGRREQLLLEVAKDLPGEVVVQQMCIADTQTADDHFEHFIRRMGDVQLIVISAGIGYRNPRLERSLELETINTNVSGFTLIAGAAFRYFKKEGKGHLVGISSIMSLRGSANAPAYNASKAYMANYLEGLRLKALNEKLKIVVTDVRPGYVQTDMAEGDRIFWVASPEIAASQIFDAIRGVKRRAYITKRWNLVALIIRLIPDPIYNKALE